MGKSRVITGKLNPIYFWDVDFPAIDESSAARLIIERIFNLGSVDEIKHVIDYYGEEKVIEVLTNMNYIDPKTFNYIKKIYQIPANKFKCHRRKRSKNQPWSS